jgi:hypothetical protein
VWNKGTGWRDDPEAFERALSFLAWAVSNEAARKMADEEG